MNNFNKTMLERNCYFDNILDEYMTKEAKDIFEKVNKKKYKGIIVYFEAIKFESFQRPQHILLKLAKLGYLCFFCDVQSEKFSIYEYAENFYVINKEEVIISALRNVDDVIAYISYGIQFLTAQKLNKPKLWYDILDEPSFFSNYKYLKKTYKELIENADIITYSSKKLEKICRKRKDSIYLSNACNIEDYVIENEDNYTDENLEKIKEIKKNNKIIGYFGAIENWFDTSIIKELNKIENVKIVIIGTVAIAKNKLDLSNVICLGKIEYKKIKYYSRLFDVAIIPFKKNKITNSVSPVKFFEYAASNVPCVSTSINEMIQYEDKKAGVFIANNKKEFIEYVKEILNNTKKSYNLDKIAIENTWENKVKELEIKIKDII